MPTYKLQETHITDTLLTMTLYKIMATSFCIRDLLLFLLKQEIPHGSDLHE